MLFYGVSREYRNDLLLFINSYDNCCSFSGFTSFTWYCTRWRNHTMFFPVCSTIRQLCRQVLPSGDLSSQFHGYVAWGPIKVCSPPSFDSSGRYFPSFSVLHLSSLAFSYPSLMLFRQSVLFCLRYCLNGPRLHFRFGWWPFVPCCGWSVASSV